MADELDPLREAYGPDSLSTADVRDLYRAPVRRYADPSPEERSTFAPLVKPRGSSEYELGVPGAIMEPWHAIKALMGHGYQPGTGDEQGIRNSTDVAGALAGYGTMAGAPSGALASNAARIGHNAGPPMEGKLPWSAPRVEPTVPNIPLAPGNKYGFYSKLEDALHRFSDNDTVTPQKLSQMGVSKAEMEARLPGFTGGTKAGDLHALAAENPVELRESKYSHHTPTSEGFAAYREAHGLQPNERVSFDDLAAWQGSAGTPKWSNWATDPSPTANYGESVLHLGPSGRAQAIEARMKENQRAIHDGAQNADLEGLAPTDPKLGPLQALRSEQSRLLEDLQQIKAGNFKSGHWDEPNAIAHTRYSTLKDVYGKPVLLADEIQSDWGQKLREGGVRDEAKIADLGKRLEDAEQYHATSDTEARNFLEGQGIRGRALGKIDQQLDNLAETGPEHLRDDALTRLMDLVHARDEAKLLRAEYETARASTPGHPLVNTTDQWTATAMRHLLQKAHEAGAEGIALTPGAEQVERFNLARHVGALRYNPTTQELNFTDPATAQRWAKPLTTIPPGWSRVPDKVPPEKLSEHLGKEVAEKLLAQPVATEADNKLVYHDPGWHELRDLSANPDPTVLGGHGMRYAYDQMYPKQLEKMLRKMDPQHPGRSETRLVPSDFDPKGMTDVMGNLSGAKYQQYLNNAEGTPFANPFHYFPLTPKVRQAIERGLPLFSEGGAVPSLRDYYGDK